MGRSAAPSQGHGAARREVAAVPLPLPRDRPEKKQALAGLLIGLQCVGRAAVVVDEQGEIVGMNPLAQPFVDALSRTCPSRPSICGAAAGHRIRDLVDMALRPAHAAEDAAAVIDLPGVGRVIVRATNVRVVAPSLFEEPRVLLEIAGLGLDSLPAASFLRRVLGLTVTEAEVALALACGATASAIARDRAVSLETVRSHLKTIFAKTGTRRQATLVALVLQLRGVSSPG